MIGCARCDHTWINALQITHHAPFSRSAAESALTTSGKSCAPPAKDLPRLTVLFEATMDRPADSARLEVPILQKVSSVTDNLAV